MLTGSGGSERVAPAPKRCWQPPRSASTL